MQDYRVNILTAAFVQSDSVNYWVGHHSAILPAQLGAWGQTSLCI